MSARREDRQPERSLGPGLPEVSVVGYGAWPLSDSAGRPTEDEAIRVIHAALDGGATLIDTADAYCVDQTEVGHNERLVARALDAWSGPREVVIVATKGGFVRPGGRWVSDGRPEHLRAACDRSLRALGVERIDLYQLHSPDPDVPFDETVGALAELGAAGKVRWIGLSNVSVSEIRRAREIVEVVSVQNRLNPFFREAVEDGVVRYCDEAGLGFLAYSPVGGGRLNKKLPGIPVLQAIADAHGASAHAVVLAWGLAQGSSVIVIPAARREVHVCDSQAAARIVLSEAELTAIDRAEFSIA
jgi:aryl-alcohol dehydrogenase-like predicted oxidoreductase